MIHYWIELLEEHDSLSFL